MTIEHYRSLLEKENRSQDEREAFVLWVQKYGNTIPRINGRIPVTPESVIDFLRGLRRAGMSAQERLRAFCAIESYRAIVLKRTTPLTRNLGRRMHRYALRERLAVQSVTNSIPMSFAVATTATAASTRSRASVA